MAEEAPGDSERPPLRWCGFLGPTAMPNRQDNEPRSIEELLLAPPNLQIARQVRNGRAVAPIQPPSSLVRWSDEVAGKIHGLLIRWLSSGDMQTLAELLRTHPTAISHPAVFHQILHLASLTRKITEDEAGEWLESTTVPPGTGQAARAALRDLLRAWVGRLLPGSTIEPTRLPRRRGAPQQVSDEESLELLLDFQELQSKLSRRAVMDFRLRDGETRESLIDRTARLVQEIYQDSWFALTSSPPSGRPDADPREWTVSIRPLPESVTRDIARYGVRNRAVSKPRLVYGLLAHALYNPPRTPEQIRGIIERAEADAPASLRRRARRR